jgi:DNA-binding beta-propeller fold protein YncE
VFGAATLLLAACSTAPAAAPALDPQEERSEIESGRNDSAAEDESAEDESVEENATVSERSFAGTTPAPEFIPGLDWLNTDRPLTLGELQGKLVLLDFWTYGCINCMHNFPGLKQLEAEYPNELVVIGVHSAKFENEGETENIRQIILRYDLEHPVVNDNQFEVWNTWGARAWPTLVLIDPRGNIVGGHSGEGVYPVFKPVIESLVQEFDALGELDRTPLELKLEREGLPSTVLSFPGKVLANPEQGRLFIADTNHHRIVQADIETGRVIAVYGNGEVGFVNGSAMEAQFYNPQGMALSPDGSVLYVADVDNHAVRTVQLDTGAVTTLVGTGAQARQYPPAPGIAPEVELSSPWDLALDENSLYIAMAGSHQIWIMDLESGLVEAFAGSGREGWLDGFRIGAELAQPSGIALGPQGRLYFADSEGSSIRWVDVVGDSLDVGTLAGSGASLFDFGDVDGVGRGARLQHPLGIASDGELLYVADTYNSKIKLIDPETAEVTTFLGGEQGWRDGDAPLFYEPGGVDLIDGVLYVADTNNHAIRFVDLESGATSTLVLSGIEDFTRAGGDQFGAELTLDEVEVGAGGGTLVLDVRVPEGYKFNDLAPSSATWEVQGGVVEIPAEASFSIKGPSFPMQFAIEFFAGSGSLTADLTLYYCVAETEELCLIEQVRVTQPLTVGEGEDRVSFEYAIPDPELPTN